MLRLNLVTPSKRLLTDLPVEEVFVPAYMGELNILPGHAALMTTLGTGILRYRRSEETDVNHVAVSWGYLEVANNVVTVLAETAETPEEIDVDRAKQAQQKAQAALGDAGTGIDDIQKYTAKLERSLIRQQVAAGVSTEAR